MAVEDIKIKLTQYDWTGSVQTPEEASIFSDKSYTTNVAPFDLIDYLLDEDLTLRWSFENIRDDFESPKLLPFGSEITMKVSNYDGMVASFFKMNSGTAYIKWKCEIFYKNKLIHSGWITPEGVEYTEGSGTGSDTHILIIRVKDLITEIKEYFSNTPLKSNMDVNWEGKDIFTDIWYLRFSRMLKEQFPGVEFVLKSSIANMKVMATPWFIIYSDNSWAWWKTGYERVYTNGENRWDWLRRLCNAMGFVIFSFVDDIDNKQKVAIKNRSDGGLTTLHLNPDLMIEYSKSKEHNNSIYDAVVINNGTMIGGDYAFAIHYGPGYVYFKEFKGGRLIIISEKYESNYSCIHFNRVVKDHPSTGSFIIKLNWENHKLQCIRSEDDNRITLYKAKGIAKPEKPFGITSISKDKILYIDTGSSYPEAMKIRLDTNSYNTGHTIGETPEAHHELIYLGNYGEMLTGIEAGGGAQTYEDYISSGQFKANFNSFLSNMERFVYRYVHKEVITSPYYKVTGSNGQSILYGRFWDIASLEVDLINEITSFDLIGQKFTFSQ